MGGCTSIFFACLYDPFFSLLILHFILLVLQSAGKSLLPHCTVDFFFFSVKDVARTRRGQITEQWVTPHAGGRLSAATLPWLHEHPHLDLLGLLLSGGDEEEGPQGKRWKAELGKAIGDSYQI